MHMVQAGPLMLGADREGLERQKGLAAKRTVRKLLKHLQDSDD